MRVCIPIHTNGQIDKYKILFIQDQKWERGFKGKMAHYVYKDV